MEQRESAFGVGPKPSAVYTGPVTVAKPIDPFAPDKTDAVFALLAFGLGFLFLRWILFGFRGWGMAAFAAVFFAFAVTYFVNKKQRIAPAAWFYCAVAMLSALSFALYDNFNLAPVAVLFLMCLASYFVLTAAGLPLLGKTSNFLLLDGLNSAFAIPFSNFGCQYKSLKVLKAPSEHKKQVWPVLLGLLLALIVGAIVLPLLMEADNGGFAQIAKSIADWFRLSPETVQVLVQLALGVPVAAYLFGLLAGSVHKRNVTAFSLEGARKNAASMRFLPSATVVTLLLFVCALYAVFIASQIPYFFSAFSGARPDGYAIYSEYARKGFFELCSIAFLNLALLTATNLLCKKERKDSPLLKTLNAILALVTLLLIVTAFSKMAMYIGAYGLSMRRLLPCVFMVFLAVVFVGVLVLQKWEFSIVRLSVVAGSVLLCALLLSDPNGIVVRTNAQRYLSGTLAEFDTAILYQSGAAGVPSALSVYNQTSDNMLKQEIKKYLISQRMSDSTNQATARDNLQSMSSRAALIDFATQQGQ